MGYMGFGMRRENYTRKPKHAFEKIKKVYGENPKLPTSAMPADREAFKSLPQKKASPFYQSKELKVTVIVAFLIVGVGLSWDLLYKSHYIKYKKSQFESEGISDFYFRNKSEFDHLNNFFSARPITLKSIERVPENNVLLFSIAYSASGKRSTAELNNKSAKENMDEGKSDGVHSSPETISRNERSKNDDLRIYKLRLKEDVEMSASILSYLRTTKQEISRISEIINGNMVDVFNEEDLTIVFRHPLHGEYKIVYGNRQTEVEGLDEVASGSEISEGVYWEKGAKK